MPRRARSSSRWRLVFWGAAMVMLLLPLVAMQVTDEVNWGARDFVLFATMLVCAGGAYELAARITTSRAYRAAAGIALAGAFVLIWINLAVGIIGSEDNPANLVFGAVPAVGIAGALMVRFQPSGMMWAMVAAALVQALIALAASIAGSGAAVILTGIFVAPWLGSAWLFRRAALEEAGAGSPSA